MKAGDIVYITRNALTEGIQKGKVYKYDDNSRLVNLVNDQYAYYRLNQEAFETYEEACTKAENMRLDKIESLKKSLSKFEKIKFE